MKTIPKLSIIVPTYNHEDYIAETLESILAQKVDFEYEVIILEDCSTDKTRKIILEYKNKFQNIRLFFNKKNYGVKFSSRMGKKYSTGEYVAILEGDDYWIDKNKLQQQIDFLDSNPNFIGCAHNTEVFYVKDHKRQNMFDGNKSKSVVDIVDLINGTNYFHTSSYVWRDIFKGGLPKVQSYNNLMGDWFLSMLYAKNGKIKYINKVMSCYRVTGQGVWSGLSKYKQEFDNIRGMYLYNKLLNHEYNEEFKRIWWACNDVIGTIPKNCKTFLLILKLYFLKKSIDVTANKNCLIWCDNLKNFFERELSCRSRSSRFYKIFCRVLLSSGRRLDAVMMKCFEFLFDFLHFFDINRYYLYYKLRFYRFFNINIYKKDI